MESPGSWLQGWEKCSRSAHAEPRKGQIQDTSPCDGTQVPVVCHPSVTHGPQSIRITERQILGLGYGLKILPSQP